MTAYLLLGNLSFEVISVLSLNFTAKQGFASQEKIEASPTLQWVGRELNEVKTTLRFSFVYADPDAQIAVIKKAFETAQPLSLVEGSGNYKGKYVIEDLQISPTKTDEQGKSRSVDVTLALKEWQTAASLLGQLSTPNLSPFTKLL